MVDTVLTYSTLYGCQPWPGGKRHRKPCQPSEFRAPSNTPDLATRPRWDAQNASCISLFSSYDAVPKKIANAGSAARRDGVSVCQDILYLRLYLRACAKAFAIHFEAICASSSGMPTLDRLTTRIYPSLRMTCGVTCSSKLSMFAKDLKNPRYSENATVPRLSLECFVAH
jgi:hypothetical protein